MKRRIACIAISCMMILTLLPYTAYADTKEAAGASTDVQTEEGTAGDAVQTEPAVAEALQGEQESAGAGEAQEQQGGGETPAGGYVETEDEVIAEGPQEEPAEAPAAEEPAAPIDIEQEQVQIEGIADKTYTGEAIEQDQSAITVTLSGTVLTEQTEENPDGDYTISYENNVNAGEAFVVVTGQNKYKGEVRAAFTIAPKDLSKAKVASVSTQSFTGSAIKPTPAVTLGGEELEKGKDYKFSYKNNKGVGTATITVTGKNNYKGTVTRTFKITDKSAKSMTVSSLKCSFKNKAYTNYRLPYAARPYNLYLTARKGGVMELKWTDCKSNGADISGYIILRKTKPSDTYKEIARVSAKTVTYTDKSSKKNNQMYYYAIVGYKKNSNGIFTVSPARNAGGVTYESKSNNPYSPVISKTKMTMYVGKSSTLTLNYSKYKRVCSKWTRWYSSDPSVATVSAGKVKAVGAGTCTITAKTANGRNIKCTVTVKKLMPFEAVVAKAKKEIGYMATGSGTYGTRFAKYAKELDAMGDIYNGPKYGYDWCDIFADWCYIKALGKTAALKAINQPKYGCGAGCYFSAGYYREMGRFSQTPAVGAQIFYDWDGDKREDHTGIVVKYDATYVYTIEGNVGGGNGMVAERKHKRTYKCITGYGKPKW